MDYLIAVTMFLRLVVDLVVLCLCLHVLFEKEHWVWWFGHPLSRPVATFFLVASVFNLALWYGWVSSWGKVCTM